MKEFTNLGFICFMAFMQLNALKQSNRPVCTAKYKYMAEKQYSFALAEYDKYYSENYEDIIYEPVMK